MTDAERKAALRAEALARRAALSLTERAAAGEQARQRAEAFLSGFDGTVALYAAFRNELDTAPLLHRLAEAGRRLALPVTIAGRKILIFRAWQPGEPLATGRFGIPEPLESASEIEPDVLVIAPVAFDRRGYRIGYGAGFYDRTIPMLRARRPVVALGLAFACQEVEAVPDEQHDVALDAIVTDRETIRPPAGSPGMG